MARVAKIVPKAKQVYFREDQLELIRHIADEQKLSESEVIRNAIDKTYGRKEAIQN